VFEALEPFFADGYVEEVLYELKSGKEAVVYCCRGGARLQGALVAAKVYKARQQRSFHNDWMYREGRVILDARARRAAAKRTDFGREVASTLWTDHEWQVLRQLRAVRADVPRPLAHAEGALLLEFIGDEHGAAPQLKDVRLTPGEAEAALERLLDNLRLWLMADVVHADLSAYNILYWQGVPVSIDFPQAVDPRVNGNAFDLLLRDLTNLARYFARQGVDRDPYAMAERIWAFA
jgi:RIO kinase 1